MRPVTETARSPEARLDTAFAKALLDPSRPVPDGWQGTPGTRPDRRFAVYRNNVMHSLTTVLGDRFPVVREWVGDAFFSAMAASFVVEHLPSSPCMHAYGDRLPDWLDRFAPAGDHPHLSDLARLEWLRGEVLHAADVPSIDALTLADWCRPPSRLLEATLVLQPSTRVFRSTYAVVSLWAAHQLDPLTRDSRLAAWSMSGAESALVYRDHDDQAVVMPVSADDAALLARLAAGTPLGEAAIAHPSADLTRVLASLWREGLVSHIHPTCDT